MSLIAEAENESSRRHDEKGMFTWQMRHLEKMMRKMS